MSSGSPKSEHGAGLSIFFLGSARIVKLEATPQTEPNGRSQETQQASKRIKRKRIQSVALEHGMHGAISAIGAPSVTEHTWHRVIRQKSAKVRYPELHFVSQKDRRDLTFGLPGALFT